MRVALLEEDEAQITYLTHILSQIPWDDGAITCTVFTSGHRLRSTLRHDTFDLLILDWAVSDMEGIELLRWLRNFQKSETPVMIVASRSSEADVVKAFSSGADDYVNRPFRAGEFAARVTRLLRRKTSPKVSPSFTFGDWTFDRFSTTARIFKGSAERTVVLTEREFRLALALFQHLGSPLSRSHLLEYSGVSGEESGSRALDSHIYRLRSKLLLEGAHGIRLQTVYGYGYRLDWAAPETDAAAGAPAAPSPGGAAAALPAAGDNV